MERSCKRSERSETVVKFDGNELSSLKAVTLWNEQWKTFTKSKLQLYINTLPLFRIFLNQKHTTSEGFF